MMTMENTSGFTQNELDLLNTVAEAELEALNADWSIESYSEARREIEARLLSQF